MDERFKAAVAENLKKIDKLEKTLERSRKRELEYKKEQLRKQLEELENAQRSLRRLNQGMSVILNSRKSRICSSAANHNLKKTDKLEKTLERFRNRELEYKKEQLRKQLEELENAERENDRYPPIKKEDDPQLKKERDPQEFENAQPGNERSPQIKKEQDL